MTSDVLALLATADAGRIITGDKYFNVSLRSEGGRVEIIMRWTRFHRSWSVALSSTAEEYGLAIETSDILNSQLERLLRDVRRSCG